MIIETNSKLNNIWELKTVELDKIELIHSFYKCSLLTSKIIANKNIKFEGIKTYLNPTLKETWIETTKIPNINKASQIIQDIIKNKKTVGIIGDYDVDGLTSSVILKELFDSFNIETKTWIPSRNDGYGPNESALKYFKENPVDLIIMVDCGTTAFNFKEQYSKEILVIDHHTANKAINATIINPNAHIYNEEIQQEFKEMSAGTLSFFIASHILKIENHKSYHNILKSMLDLVALSTICDMMPLNNLNRALVKEGLKQIKEQKRIGLSQLINFANIKLPITAKDIGFNIGPRLNATGRIDSPLISLRLLQAKTYEETADIINKIERTNNYRKEIQQIAFNEAIEEAKNCEDKIICIANENWNAGIVGIIAAMIQNETKKTTIIGNITNNEIKASARSNSINIGMLIEKAVENKIIESGGGHKAAAGLTCTIEQWKEFKKWINIQDFKITKYNIKIDAISTLEDISDDFKKLSPFGINNESPKILIKEIIVEKIIDKSTYFQVFLTENYTSHLFFINQSQINLINSLKKALKLNKKINIVITLSEKKPFSIEDISY